MKKLTSAFIYLLVISLALGACDQPTPEPTPLQVSSIFPVDPVQQNEIFSIKVLIANPGQFNAHVNQIKLPGSFMTNAVYQGSEPALLITNGTGGEAIFNMDVTIAPAGVETFTFNFLAGKIGGFSGTGQVFSAEKSYLFDLQVNVEAVQAAAVNLPEPSATAPSPDVVPSEIPTSTSTIPPEPTATPLPTATFTPQPTMPAMGEILYWADFSTSATDWGWYTGSEMSRNYSQGRYCLSLNKSDWVYWYETAGSYSGELIIQAKTYFNGGSETGSRGIIYGYQDDDNFYVFLVSSEGYVDIGLLKNNEWSNLFSEQMDGIDPTSNEITVVRVGSELSMFIDGTLYASVQDSTITSGKVGVIIESWDEPEVKACFDDLMVTRIGD